MHKSYFHEDFETGHWVPTEMSYKFIGQIQIFYLNFYLKVHKNLNKFFQDLVLIYVIHITNFRPFFLSLNILLFLNAIFAQFFLLIHFHLSAFELLRDLFFYSYLIHLFYCLILHFLLNNFLILVKIFNFRSISLNILWIINFFLVKGAKNIIEV